MKSSSKPKTSKAPPPKGAGAGYRLGPRKVQLVPVDAKWMTTNQVRARYGGRSHMWIVRNLKSNPDFPRPSRQGRLLIFSVAEFNAYDHLLLSKRVGGEAPRKSTAQAEDTS
jgi:hypothetical protein